MARFAGLPEAVRSKIRFIHFNHTNPVFDSGSEAARMVKQSGFGLAREGEIFGL
jgi:pyrroloquinoline quinone biosynthesis protein B